MNLASIRIITPEINRLVKFYEEVTSLSAHWYTEDFAEIISANCTLAIGSTRTLSLFNKELKQVGSGNNLIIEYLVSDVDQQYEKIKHLLNRVNQEPTTMPWGNRSLLFCDPDGNMINFFTPVSLDAIKRSTS
jgi:predicted enzyme related to lactoylglutathione lyase